jgi:hypothetical protein
MHPDWARIYCTPPRVFNAVSIASSCGESVLRFPTSYCRPGELACSGPGLAVGSEGQIGSSLADVFKLMHVSFGNRLRPLWWYQGGRD